MAASDSNTSLCNNWASIFWPTCLIVSIIAQRILNDYVGILGGSLLSGFLMILVVSVIYVRYLCCSGSRNDQRGTADDNHSRLQGQEDDSSIRLVSDDVTTEEGGGNDQFEMDSSECEHENNTDNGSILYRNEIQPIMTTAAPNRLYFLDNIKSFLTALVVSHHVTCAFGGGGTNAWFLVVGCGDETNTFTKFRSAFVTLNQAYFMSFFFFISGYFVSSSYQRKGSVKFLQDKAKRLWIPAFFVAFVMAPLVMGYCQWFLGEEIIYIPFVFHCWYLYWLLLLCFVYTQIQDQARSTRGGIIIPILASALEEEGERVDQLQSGETIEINNTNTTFDLPGPIKRTMIYGCGICGIVTAIFLIIVQGGEFAGMPVAIGSLPNDLLLFSIGIITKKNRWLEKRNLIRQQLGMPVVVLRFMVILEAVILLIFMPFAASNPIIGLVFLFTAGMYCVDMILTLLEFFQSHSNYQNSWTKFFSDSAYTVYIIHPVVVIGVSSLWITIYEKFVGKLEWEGLYSKTPIDGVVIGLSWLLCNLLSHAIVWPVSHYLRKLPGLRQIL